MRQAVISTAAKEAQASGQRQLIFRDLVNRRLRSVAEDDYVLGSIQPSQRVYWVETDGRLTPAQQGETR